MELFTLLLFKQKRYKLYMKQEKFFRLLAIEGAYNIRDLGGYPTSDHKHVKWKTFIRSGDLDKLTESDLTSTSGACRKKKQRQTKFPQQLHNISPYLSKQAT